MANQRQRKRARRAAARANRNLAQKRPATAANLNSAVQPKPQRTNKAPRMKRQAMGKAPPMSADGYAFLKCATSPPDFQVDPGRGIPDRYTGRVVAIKDAATYAINFTEGRDTYIIIPPTPGVAYFVCDVAPGEQPTTFTGVTYPTFASNFGASTVWTTGNNRAPRPQLENYTKFRYASLAAGLYPSSNMMQFSGSVAVWKGQLSLSTATASAVSVEAADPVPASETFDLVTRHLSGTSSITPAVPRDSYVESFIHGAYSASFDMSTDFDWQDFTFDNSYSSMLVKAGSPVTTSSAAMDFSLPDTGGQKQLIPGWGNMETIIIKVTTPAGATNTANLKVWNCMEMQPSTSSTVYQFSHVSPSYDPVALELYSQIRNRLPVAVRAEQNADFWNRVSALLRGILKGAAMVPGPIGLIAHGFGQLVL